MGCHAKWLAALGQRGAAPARLLFVIEHPQTPAMQRSDVQETLQGLNPAAEERSLAQKMARGFDLDSLIEDAAVVTAPPVQRT